MLNQIIGNTMIETTLTNPVSYLRVEYERQQTLFHAQPTIVKHFIESQAQRLANALINDSQVGHFTLPDRVVSKTPKSGELAAMLIPAQMREQSVGGWIARFGRESILELLRRKLNELEQSPDRAINSSAGLIRYAMAVHMVHNLLPAGRSVIYCTDGDEQIPTIPLKSNRDASSALTSTADAIVEQESVESAHGQLLVPFVPAARRFYLPQWVAFDENGKLLVNSVQEAEAHQTSMERYIHILHIASSIAPYMVADAEYQYKRYGMLGQLINQGRALARYKTEQIIQAIVERVKKNTLNRGFSISLPFYDDQNLHMSKTEMEVIPAGRIAFKAIFILRAVRLEHAKVSQDTRLNASTRKHLLRELEQLEQAFINFPEQVVK